MAYIRKTQDVWEIQTNYGYGWEVENTETTLKDARRSYREYCENVRGAVRVRKRRERLPQTNN